MANALQNKTIRFPSTLWRLGAILVLFGWAWAGYGQLPTGWKQKIGSSNNTISSDAISINGYGYGGGNTTAEYTKGPATKAGWYFFTISAYIGYKISKIKSDGTEKNIVTNRQTWTQSAGRCRSNIVFLEKGETLKITHYAAANRASLFIYNFVEAKIDDITVGNCTLNSLPVTFEYFKFTASHKNHILNAANTNDCDWETDHKIVRYWRVKKVSGACTTEVKVPINGQTDNAFELIKKACPNEPYGKFEIRFDTRFSNPSEVAASLTELDDPRSILSPTHTIIVPELKTPPIVSECSNKIKTASWEGNQLKTSAEKVEIDKTKLNIIIENDNQTCCPLNWVIKDGTTELYSGTGQPSTSTQRILLDDNGTQEKKYTITYTISCSGQSKTEYITIRPRPSVN